MENVKETKRNDKEVLQNNAKVRDDRVVVFADGSVMSYDIAKNPRFTERV